METKSSPLFVRLAKNELCFRSFLHLNNYREHTGPNNVGFIGILQPYRDAIKLFIINYHRLLIICQFVLFD